MSDLYSPLLSVFAVIQSNIPPSTGQAGSLVLHVNNMEKDEKRKKYSYIIGATRMFK